MYPWAIFLNHSSWTNLLISVCLCYLCRAFEFALHNFYLMVCLLLSPGPRWFLSDLRGVNDPSVQRGQNRNCALLLQRKLRLCQSSWKWRGADQVLDSALLKFKSSCWPHIDSDLLSICLFCPVFVVNFKMIYQWFYLMGIHWPVIWSDRQRSSADVSSAWHLRGTRTFIEWQWLELESTDTFSVCMWCPSTWGWIHHS